MNQWVHYLSSWPSWSRMDGFDGMQDLATESNNLKRQKYFSIMNLTNSYESETLKQ